MDWIKKTDRLPTAEDGLRVRTFSPTYGKTHEMRHRIMDFEFVRICEEVTHWRKLDEPSDGNQANSDNANCAIFDVSNLLAFRKWQKENWKDIYLMSDEFMVETYKKANCG